MQNPIILPITSSKAGVGKSFFAVNLSAALASTGHKTIVIDLDLKSSNLNRYIGYIHRYPGIGSYFTHKKKLSHYLIDTNINNLQFISGEGICTSATNLHYIQKLKLIHEINDLRAEFVILNLDTGNSNNSLDFFDSSKYGFIITTFDYDTRVNTMSFFSAFMLRFIKKQLDKNNDLYKNFSEIFRFEKDNTKVSFHHILKLIQLQDRYLADKIEQEYFLYHPRIVFNKGKNIDELLEINKIDQEIRKMYGLKPDYLGYIYYDEDVIKSGSSNQLYYTTYPHGISQKIITQIAKQIILHRNNPILNSKNMLIENTLEKHKEWTELH